MPFILSAVTVEDLPTLVEIRHKAFGPSFWHTIMFPLAQPTLEVEKKKRWLREMTAALGDPHIRFQKCVDSDTDEIIAFTKFRTYREERPESEWNVTEERVWEEGARVQACVDYYGRMVEERKRILGGRPHCGEHEHFDSFFS